jgi:hypothetical protein
MYSEGHSNAFPRAPIIEEGLKYLSWYASPTESLGSHLLVPSPRQPVSIGLPIRAQVHAAGHDSDDLHPLGSAAFMAIEDRHLILVDGLDAEHVEIGGMWWQSEMTAPTADAPDDLDLFALGIPISLRRWLH